MMKKKIYIFIFIFLAEGVCLSGCTDFLSSNQILVYEPYPVQVTYTITYGYKINCAGKGKYWINYNLDLPEVLAGKILSTDIHDNNYKQIILANNNMIQWDFNSSESKEYELLITANVNVSSFITNLNAPSALTIEEISKKYPDFIEKFCKAQSNETIVFIDPADPEITDTSSEIYRNLKTNDSFLLAKELFSWFKQHTTYKSHAADDEEIQSAHVTIIRGTGDCDDLSFLYISLCRSLGIPARFIKGFLLDKNSMVQHVWVEVFVGGGIGKNGWIPVECAGTSSNFQTEINQNFGVENVDHLRLFTDDGSNESLNISFQGITYKLFSESRDISVVFYSDISNYLVLKSKQLFVDEKGNRSYN